jgi:hypothetical protein
MHLFTIGLSKKFLQKDQKNTSEFFFF